MKTLVAVAAALTLAGAAAPAASAADPKIHAHRGGSFVDGKPVYPENSLSAFGNAARRGWVVELDARVTQDGQVVVLHDDLLDRTTSCTGKLFEMTAEALANCPMDILGSPGSSLGGQPAVTEERIPRLAEVLGLLGSSGAAVNLEIKDFDADGSRARIIADAVAASGFPIRKLIVQSFFPPNLAIAQQRLPGVATSRLTLSFQNAGGIAAAVKAKDDWVSPAWPVDRSYVKRAHARKLKVAPYTLNRRSHVLAAAKIGVDAIITDDPAMARKALRRR